MSISACVELGRSTRCYVSAFQRDRVHHSNMSQGETRCLVADFNGALPKGRSIASVKWKCAVGFPVVMSNATISGRETKVDIQAQSCGCASFKCEATMDNGEVYVQMFSIDVSSRWRWFWFEDQSFAQGPTELQVSV